MYSIRKGKQAIKDGIRAYLKKDENGNYVLDEVNCLPFYMEGAPGIGKTDVAHQIAEEEGLGFVSFSLVHHTRNSLLGLPVITELTDGEKYTRFTMSEIIAKVYEAIEAGHDEGILLLDEFPCMSETIMPAMLQFLQTKEIGGHGLPRGWVLILCGNPSKYNRSARKFDAAVTDRVRKIEIEYSVNDFLEYANEHGVNETIKNYLESYPDLLYRCVNAGDKEELVTCRSWDNLGHAIDLYEELAQDVDAELIRQFIKSDEIAFSFNEYYAETRCGITREEREKVLAGKVTKTMIEKYRDLGFDTKWNVSAFFIRILSQEAVVISNGMKEMSAQVATIPASAPLSKALDKRKRFLSDHIDHVYDFFAAIDDSTTLCERLYGEVTKSPVMQRVAYEMGCSSYTKMCKAQYGKLKTA